MLDPSANRQKLLPIVGRVEHARPLHTKAGIKLSILIAGMKRREFLNGAVALALRRDRLDAAVGIIEKATRSGAVSGAALDVRQGSYTLSRTFGRVANSETPFLLASITKPMTATAVMILS